ncbi:MAG TPA: NAD(P)-binding domain-containing protein [Puia sp.]|jgi:3-hydroxyisobutyrate dehydrogenase|nr:NAD(P)-binding domain-containing protein [Puia sp.]
MIAFLGTGLLGTNFTRALLKKGEIVQVWNRTSVKAKALESYGARAFENVIDAVKEAKRIHLTLSDDEAVDEVLENASSGFGPDVIIIDHTTTSSPGAAKRSAYWKTKGYSYIHAPVFMGPPNALEGTGIMLVSGDQQIVKLLEPELSKMTGKLLNLGEKPEKAASIKLLGNLFHISLTGGIADLITLADTLNVPASELGPLLEILNPSVVAQGRLRKITSNTFDQPSWELNMARKDARLMIEQANTNHKTLMVVPAVAKKMDAWLAKGHAKDDWTIISKDPYE